MIADLASILDAAAIAISKGLRGAHRETSRRAFQPNAHQQRVIASPARCLRVLAPAGSGKTATIVEKAIAVVESDPRAQVLMLTFTNAGVNAFNSAVAERSPTLGSRCKATTLNKFGLHALMSVDSSIRPFPHDKPFIPYNAVKAVLDAHRIPLLGARFEFLEVWETIEVTKQLGVSPLDGGSADRSTLQFLHSTGTLAVLSEHIARAELDIGNDVDSILTLWLPFWRAVIAATRGLGVTLEDQKFRAYWDQASNPALARHIQGKRLTHLLVDEFQDTNLLELYLIASIAKANQSRLYIVGDDDQCIYEWKGCTPVFITRPDLLLPALLGESAGFETVILETNYRCPRNIVDASRRLIEHNEQREAKNIVADPDQGHDANIRQVRLPTSAVSMLTLARLVKAVVNGEAKHQFALLARKKAQLVPLQVLLTRESVDFYIPGDCNIFVQDSFRALLDAFEARLVLRGSQRGKGPVRYRELLLSLSNRVWRKVLFNEDLAMVKGALQQASTLEEGLTLLENAGRLPGKQNSAAVIANAIRAFADADSCAEALQTLFTRFAGFQQDYGRSKADIFLRDPPLGLLIDLATSYANESEFVRDLEAARAKAAAMSGSEERKDAAVSLLTAYRAKGREFDTVVVLDANDGFWPASQAVQSGRIEEERRLFYVAVTRAQANLLLFSSDFIQGVPHSTSPFIEEMGLDPGTKVTPKLPDEIIRELLSLYPSHRR
jgi:DNA helicase-2/ATP-dependent DNA helicase PcrA